MAEVKLSIKEYRNVVKSLYTLTEKLYEMTKKCNDYKRQRDELIEDIARVREERFELSKKLDKYCNVSLGIEGQLVDVSKERDELIMSNHKAIQDNAKLQHKLDDVVDLFNTHLYHKKAWSDNPYYDKLQNELNKILDGYPVETTRLRRLYSTEIEQALKNKDLSECLFLLEKIKMDLEEDE
ncbi:hypothetical protein [Staphylococcus sp. IVB6227]|uniref:hypothetical protein n=1 Tax=Staphylococcus sp. IVB6227 TaxID=2989768 RepID=UPI0021CFDCA5|nr:hypothetical protein [Staphylococcus sp. IVB6227]UXR79040.1 hypothetical protein MUA92_03890 [Staphylococcus sp. IVB6227]